MGWGEVGGDEVRRGRVGYGWGRDGAGWDGMGLVGVGWGWDWDLGWRQG